MNKLKFILFLLYFVEAGFGQTQKVFFSKKETLYSTKNGNAIGEVLLSIAAKSATPTNDEWLLIIGSQAGKIVEARNETTLWIFNNKTNVNQFKRDLKNQDYPVEVKGMTEFMPFCENGIRFVLKDWDELRKQTQLSFFINASSGEKVTLRLVFYSATSDKKRITIDDEAKVKLEFEIPDLSSLGNQVRQTSGGGAQGGETINLTEKITPEAAAAAAKLLEERREDALAQVNAVDRGQRIALLNSFISERNRELGLFQEDVNALLVDKKTKVSESTIDSLATIADEMKNRVDYWENGYSDILLTEEAVHDKFSKFRIAHALTSKKINELRQQQNPLNGILDFIKNNLLLSIGAGIGGLILLRLLMKLSKKLMSLAKSKMNQTVSKMKADAKKKATEESKNMFKRKKKKKQPDDEFENIDINDLAEI
jgi:hypothetical protein